VEETTATLAAVDQQVAGLMSVIDMAVEDSDLPGGAARGSAKLQRPSAMRASKAA